MQTLRALLAVGFGVAGLAAPNAHALDPSEVFEQVKNSVLVVKVYDRGGKSMGQGSGVMLPGGAIVTNCHVIEKGSVYRLSRGEREWPAERTAGDRDKDLCLLKARGVEARMVSHRLLERL